MNDAAPDLLFAASAAHSRDKPPGKIGGCVGTFLQLFDWNPRKRLFSTKRLPAERPNARKASSSKKKYKDERMPVAKLLLLAEEENRGGFPSPKKMSSASSGDRISEDGTTGKRVPGVVARLMGLESLPDERGNEGKESPVHLKMLPSLEVRPLQELLHCRQEPVLLSDLLREREYLEAKKLSLKDRLHVPVPGFVKKLPEPIPQMNYVPPKDGFKKSLRSESHLQPYVDQKYHKSLRPLKKTSRDLSDPKHLILALSPRASGDSLRPILLPSKVHNKLMSSPIKSPTKMGSRSARLLEAAVKILEPSMQSSTTRARGPAGRPSSASAKEFKDLESEGTTAEERREKLVMIERKAALSSNAGRALKGQSMSRSWNGREDTTKYNQDYNKTNGSSTHESGKRRIEHGTQSRGASPMRNTSSSRSRSNSRGLVPHEDTSMRVAEEIKTVVPQGFEEALGGGLKPLNVGRRDAEARLDKFEIEDRRAVSEKHVVSSLSSLSSLSVGNSPYSECSERSTTSSYHDPLRRSGSVKEGPAPPTPSASKSRFMRSKSVKEEKSSKLSAGGGSQTSHHTSQPSRTSHRDVRVKQEIPQQSHQSQQSHQHHQPHQPQQSHQSHQTHQPQAIPPALTSHVVSQEPPLPKVEATVVEDSSQETTIGTVESIRNMKVSKGKAVEISEKQEPDIPDAPLPKTAVAPLPEVEVSAELSASSRSSSVSQASSSVSQTSVVSSVATAASVSVSISGSASVSQVSPGSSKDAQAQAPAIRSSSGGGLLSYSRLFGARKSGERKSDSKEKSKSRAEAPKKSESSLVRSLLRRKSSPPPGSVTAPAPAQSMDKPKKRGGKKMHHSEPPSREMSDNETPGYFSEDYAMDIDCDMAAVIQANKFNNNEACKGRALHPEIDVTKDSPSKSVDDVFPEVPLDKGCLGLLDEFDECGSQRLVIEGFDCVDVDSEEIGRGGIFSYGAHLMDDYKLEEMFSTGTVIQGSGRNGFSYSPLVELDEPPRSSLENFILDGGAEVEKCVSFLGRTSVSSPEMSFMNRELLAQEAEEKDKPIPDEQLSRIAIEAGDSTPEAPKTATLNELSEAQQLEDDALEEANECVAKKFASKGRVVLSDVDADDEEAVCSSVRNEDCGQPSPVSVLDCPFEEDESRSSQGNLHESICETEEELDDDEEDLIDNLLYESAAALEPRKTKKQRKKASIVAAVTDGESSPLSGKSQTDKILGAILDISRIRCIDPSACDLLEDSSVSFEDEEEEYVRKILSVWEIFPEASGNPAGAELPIASTLFDRLESQGRASAWRREKEREVFGSPSPEDGPPAKNFKQWQGLWLHRRLVFDCVNETLAYRMKFKSPDPWMGVPNLRQQPTGKALVKEVYREIKDWRDLQTEELDTIIELDMTRGLGNWSNHNQEIAEVGLEIERTILRVMIEELVLEIMGAPSIGGRCDHPVRA